MHTLTIKVQDDFMQDFLNFVNKKKDSIYIEKDENLAYDPYFYERQDELHQLRTNIKNGTVEMVSHDDIWKNINDHLKTLDS